MKVYPPSEEQVRARAYQLFLEDGSRPGREVDHWLQAEYELMQLPLRRIAQLDPASVEKTPAPQLLLFGFVRNALSWGAKTVSPFVR